MISVPSINFCNKLYRECEGKNSYVESYANVSCDDFNSFVLCVKEAGYELRESHSFSKNIFFTFALGSDALFLSYYPDICEMRIVEEENCRYLSYGDNSMASICKPLITHIDIEEYGIAYAVRLSDSRFIIFDGGFDNEPDADRLMNCLTSQSAHEKPRVAAWILTHPHHDHYPGFTAFCKKYSADVDIEKIIFNFPDLTEESIKKIPAIVSAGETELLRQLYDTIDGLDADVYRAHSGQVYKIGDAVLEILSSPDDTFFTPVDDLNPLSLVIKMTLCSQSVMWCADAYFENAKLAKRYGSYLKCDMVQLTHHGYNGGAKEEYSLMNPSVCLAPVSEEQCLSTIDIYYDHNKHLFCDLQLEELVCGGSGDIVLPLPYKPLPNARMFLSDRINERQKDVGAKVWFFTDVSPDDLEFTVLNMTYSNAEILADLVYADSTDNVYSIKFSVDYRSSVKKNIADQNEVDADAFRFNPYPLAKKGIKTGENISVRFTSNIPVVIGGSKPASYCH